MRCLGNLINKGECDRKKKSGEGQGCRAFEIGTKKRSKAEGGRIKGYRKLQSTGE